MAAGQIGLPIGLTSESDEGKKRSTHRDCHENTAYRFLSLVLSVLRGSGSSPISNKENNLNAQEDGRISFMQREMARKQGQSELVQQALDHKRDYENALAKLREFKVDNS